MKKILLFFFFFAFVISLLPLSAQLTTAFRKNYDLASFDIPANIIEGLTPNTYILAGTNLTFIPIYGTVSQLDDTGGVVWSYRYSDASIGFQLNDIRKDAGNSQYYLCGGSESNAAVFMALDAAGNIAISKKFTINEADAAWFNRVIKTSDGGYVAVGYVTGYDPDGAGPEIKYSPITYTDNNGDSQTDYISSPLIVKLDASGNHLWHKVFRYYTAATKNPATERIYNDASFSDVIEVSDGYVAVGSYDVNQHRSATNSDGDDATPTDALILKTTTAGAITYHKQVDNPSTSTSQASKYLSALNTTSAGAIIAGGTDDSRELIQKFAGPGGFSNTFSRLFRYSTSFFSITDPSDVSQIYEVSGGTDLVTMTMYIKPLSFFSNAIHRVNSTATSNVWAKRYDFNLISILPRGSLVSDAGYIAAAMTAGGTNYDYHVIKTDPNGDTPTSGCPANSFTPTALAGPTTFADPYYNSWSGTPGTNTIGITRTSITLTTSFVCTKTICTAPAAATSVTTSSNPICEGQSTTIFASGPGTGVTYYVYTSSTGGSIIGSAPMSVSPLITTTYYVETSLNSDPGCVSSTRTPVTVNVNSNPAPTISSSGSTSFCQGGSVTLTANSSLSINSYSWSTGATSQSINVTNAGSYTVTVTYTNGCTNSSSPTTVTVNSNPAPAITASGATTFCQGNSVTLTSSAANSYLWSDGSTLQSINVSASGTYNVTVTDGNGCTGSAGSSTTITVNPNPTPTISGANSVCSNGTATYSVTNSGNAFSWSISNGTINSGQVTNSVSVTWNASGAASISITETNGSTTCTGSNTLNVTINSSLNPTITANGPTSICQNDTLVLDAGSGYSTYLWSTNETSQTISVTTSGTYSVSVTDAGGCSGSSSTPVTITVNNNPTPTITASGNTTICQGDSVLLTATSAATYLWSTGETSQAIYADSTGSFSVTVTDGNGCSGSSSVATNVDVISNPVVTITSSDSTTFCQGDSITLDAGLGFTNYLWSTGDTTQTIVVDSTGNYSISVTDANGCSNDSSTTSTSVTVNPLPIASISGNTAACDGDTVFLIASGGITYLWNTGDNDSALTATSSGIYVVSVNDSNNCSDIYSASVIVNPAYSITTSENICTGDSIFLQGNYQNTAGTYYDTLLSVNSCDSIVVTTLFVTSYSISVPDTICSGDSVFLQGNYQTISGIYVDSLSSINGCDSVVSTILTVSSYSISVADTICSGDSVFLQGNYQTTGGIYNDTLSSANGCDSIVTTILSVDSSYSVSLSGTICSGDSIFLQGNYQTLAGTYYDTLNSTGGCDSILATTLTVNPSPIISIVIDSNNLCAGDSAFLCVTPAGLNPLWSNGVLGDCFISSPPNTILYSVTVTDANSCSKSDSVLVTVTQIPVVSIAGDSITCSNEPVTLIAAGGSTYSWSTGDSDSVAVVNPTVDSTYFVTVSNGNCTANDSAFVIVLPAPDAVNAGASPDTAIHFGDKATLSAAGNGNYFWSPSDDLSCVDCINPIANPDSTTVYYLTVTAANGCTFSDSVIVTVDYPPGDVFVPNIFSPNGDGQNDKLFVYGRYVDRIELFIYDRWGEKIFETTDKTQGWDGTYKGELLNTAVFAYYLKAYLFDGTVYEKHGNTTLLR